MNPRKGMRLRPHNVVTTCSLLLALLGSSLPLAGQSVLNGSVRGTVVSDDGQSVPGASVTLHSLDLDLVRILDVDRDGRFSFEFVIPGTYEVRIEAIQYIPLVIRPVSVSAGTSVSVDGRIRAASGTVTTIDTVAAAGSGGSSRLLNGGVRVSAEELASLPDADAALAGAADLISFLDPSLGAEGLPASMTALWVDGVPFEVAGHPARRSGAVRTPVLPRAGISTMDGIGNATDAEFGGTAGAFLAMTSASNIPEAGSSLYGGWSGDALWNSSELDFTAPALASMWAGGATSIDVAQDTSRLFVAGDFSRQQRPTPPRASDMALLAGLGDALTAQLSAPATETTTRAAGVGRLDWWFGDNSRFVFRASGGWLRREFDGAGPARAGRLAPVEATDVSASGALVTEYGTDLTIEARGGVSVSSRRYDGGLGRPTALDVRTGVDLGDPLNGSGESSRLDVFFSPVAHLDLGTQGLVKGGIQLRATQHTIDYSEASGGQFYFGSASALAAGRGSYFSSRAPETDFAPSEIGGFLQYQWTTAPGLTLSFGARYDVETLPTGASFNAAWFRASGLRNDSLSTSHAQVGLRAAVTWDVQGNGSTLVFAGGTLHQGAFEPGALHEVFSRDGATTVTRAYGSGMAWPDATAPSGATTLPVLSMFGPDARAPQSLRSSLGIVSRVAEGWSVFVQGTSRRTDFLTRRRNLNLSILPVGEDAFGRVLLGDLEKDGSMVTARQGSNRRFPGFDDVWALDPDGWSEYRGATLGVEFENGTTRFHAAYTRSETTDNWFGAGGSSPLSELIPAFPESVEGWDEGTSDFDIPEQAVASITMDVGPADVSAIYRYRSALPFTPGYRAGVDVNGDGSGFNDVAFIPALDQVGDLTRDWSCLSSQAGRMADRNSCRGPAVQSLDARISFSAGQLGTREVAVTVDALGLLEPAGGLRDTALLLVDPNAPLQVSGDGSMVTVPTTVNPSFGSVLVPYSSGRILRIGVRIGGPQR